jgi:excisionase family DNA binding protein
MEALLSIERAAQVLGISPWTVRRYIATQKLIPVRIGRRVLLEERELQRIVDLGRIKTSADCADGARSTIL